MPDLSGVLPGSRTQYLPMLDMVAVYYDTDDRCLDHHKVTLRLRLETPATDADPAGHVGEGNGSPEAAVGARPAAVPQDAVQAEDVQAEDVQAEAVQAEAVWTVKLPGAPSRRIQNRTEVTWPYQGDHSVALTSAPEVDARAASFVRGLTTGLALRPIARLETVRQRVHLLTSDGRLLAEVAHDCVTGTNLLRAAGGLGATTVVFSELEVELAHGSALEVADAIVAHLGTSGATRSKRRSKLATVMQMTGMQTPGGDEARPPKRKEPTPRPPGTVSQLVSAQAQTCLDALQHHDVHIRLSLLEGTDGAEEIHQTRIAARKARTVFDAIAALHLGSTPACDASTPPCTAPLAATVDGLRAFGETLGRARDAWVRRETLARWATALGLSGAGDDHAAISESPGDAAPLLSSASNEHASALASLEQMLDSPQYDRLLRDLGLLATAADQAFGPVGQRSADGLVTEICARQFGSLGRKVKRAKHDPDDRRLHQARIQAKKLRYLAELAVSTSSGRAAKKAKIAAARAEKLQNLLGKVHDAGEMRRWLEHTFAGLGEQAALAAGQLLAICQKEQEGLARKWEQAWRSLDEHAREAWPGAKEAKRARKS